MQTKPAIDLRRFPTLPAIGVLTGAYLVAGKLALKLAYLNPSASPVWPAAGIALAALLVLGYRAWPGIFLGALLVNLTTAGNLGTSVVIAMGNTLEAVCGAWLVNRFAGGASVFDRVGNVFKFASAVILSTLISPTLGLTSLALSGFAPWGDYNGIWLTWWLGDVTGNLVIAPLIVLWCRGTTRPWTRGEIVEVSLLFLALLVLAEISFGGWFPISAKNYPVAFLYGPFLILLALRFTPRETVTGVFIFASIAIWGTLHGVGPFVLATENQSLLILQTRTAVLAITAMALAAAMAERRRADSMIEEQKTALEAANQTKDNFLAMLSHELRTPLTPVIAALEMLETESLDASESKATLAMIRRNIDLESRLIDDLLDLTRITKGKLQLKNRVLRRAPSDLERGGNVRAGNWSQEPPSFARPGSDGSPRCRRCAKVSADYLESVEQRHQVHRGEWRHHHLDVESNAAKFDRHRHRHRYWHRTRNNGSHVQSLRAGRPLFSTAIRRSWARIDHFEINRGGARRHVAR